jgi:uncharacterized membrane protein YqhA
MLRFAERLFESALWNSRYVVVLAAAASVCAAFATFFMATVDVFYLVQHLAHYADSSLTANARKALRT